MISLTDAIAAQTQAIGALVQALANSRGRDSAFAPGSNDPYVMPGPRDFYSYTQRASSLANGATTSLTYQIEADSYFYMNALTYTADIAAGPLTTDTNVLPLVTLTLFDSASGRQLMANAVPLPSIAGNGTLPFRLPKPRRFAPTAQITATLVNYSTGTTYNISLTLSGFKVYTAQQITSTGPIGG